MRSTVNEEEFIQTEWIDESWPGPEVGMNLSSAWNNFVKELSFKYKPFCDLYKNLIIQTTSLTQKDFVLVDNYKPDYALIQKSIQERNKSKGPRSGNKFRSDGKPKW